MSQHNLTPPPANSSRISKLCGFYTYHLTDLGNALRLIALFGNHLRYIPSHGWCTSTYPVHPVGSVHSATASNSVSAINPVSDSTFNHPVGCVHSVGITAGEPQKKTLPALHNGRACRDSMQRAERSHNQTRRSARSTVLVPLRPSRPPPPC